MSDNQTTDEDAQVTNLSFNDWQDALARGQLLGHECSDCGQTTGFPRGACDRCGSRELTVAELPKTGDVYSETLVNVAPEGFDGGYRLALIDLGSARLLGRIDGDVAIGDTVTFSGTFDGKDTPAPVFKPIDTD